MLISKVRPSISSPAPTAPRPAGSASTPSRAPSAPSDPAPAGSPPRSREAMRGERRTTETLLATRLAQALPGGRGLTATRGEPLGAHPSEPPAFTPLPDELRTPYRYENAQRAFVLNRPRLGAGESTEAWEHRAVRGLEEAYAREGVENPSGVGLFQRADVGFASDRDRIRDARATYDAHLEHQRSPGGVPPIGDPEQYSRYQEHLARNPGDVYGAYLVTESAQRSRSRERVQDAIGGADNRLLDLLAEGWNMDRAR